MIAAGRGDDTVTGLEGDDLVCGARGDDVLRGKGGDDELRGGAGDDDLRGGGGSNRCRGGAARTASRAAENARAARTLAARRSLSSDAWCRGAPAAAAVRAVAASQLVLAAPTFKRVFAALASDHVGAPGAADEVIALEAYHPVVSAPGGDHVVAVRAFELVGPLRADDRRLAPRAGAERRVAAEQLAHCHSLRGQLIGVGAGDLAAAFGPRDLADERGELVAGRVVAGFCCAVLSFSSRRLSSAGGRLRAPTRAIRVGDRRQGVCDRDETVAALNPGLQGGAGGSVARPAAAPSSVVPPPPPYQPPPPPPPLLVESVGTPPLPPRPKRTLRRWGRGAAAGGLRAATAAHASPTPRGAPGQTEESAAVTSDRTGVGTGGASRSPATARDEHAVFERRAADANVRGTAAS